MGKLVSTGSTSKSALLGAVGLLIVSACGGSPGSPSPSPSSAPIQTPVPTASAAPSGTPLTTFIATAPHDRALGMTVTLPSASWRYDNIALGFGKGIEVDNLPEALILLWSFPAGTEFWVYGDPCHWSSTRPDVPAKSAADIVAALAEQPTRDATEPADVAIGGYPGKLTTLTVPDDAVFEDCDQGYFTTYGVTGDEPTRTQQGPGQIDTFWFIDVGGAIAVLDATYRRDTPSQELEEMRAIAGSIVFEAP